MKVYLEPNFVKPDSGEGGIRRLVEAQRKYLPEFGIEFVGNPEQAELTAGHGGSRPIRAGVPFVSHSHGLYWSDYHWDRHEDNANRYVIDALTAADAITVPSEWVGRAYARGLCKPVQVIYHGIEPSEWEPSKTPGNYVLWNKPRHDAVSNVNDLMRIAKEMPETPFVSTLGEPLPNLKLVGRMPYAQMKATIQNAGVYLATARETFGIGTLEALASGVPVAGWNYGGQREIIVQGESGYLAEPGNYKELAECIRKCFSERQQLGFNARLDAQTRWLWSDKIQKYAQLYTQVYEDKHRERPAVSVIVTCHNLAKYLPQALDSVLAQTLADWECIIVNDASTDETERVTEEWEAKDPRRFIGILTTENVKLSRARNLGFAKARGRYVINLDADDRLTPATLKLLVTALDHNPRLHIVYGSLDILSEDGKSQNKNSFPRAFNYLEQMAHLNQIYYGAMMRRDVWESVGGYRERMWRAEDAEFYCRATSYGFRAAKVTEETCLLWRFRADGKSATERRTYPDIDGDWTADFPWAIAHTASEGVQKKEKNELRFPNFASLPFGAPLERVPVWHREHPTVSIVIPLGPGHERYVIDALDSCIAQTFHDWEVVVVNDTGTALEHISGAPYAHVVSTEGRTGAGHARNVGLEHARAPLVLFLDADDQLHPSALQLMVTEYAKGHAGYVYSGWKVIRPGGEIIEFKAEPSDRMAWLTGQKHGRNIVSVLMSTEDAKTIRFNDQMRAYEDWDFFCRCAVQGVCGVGVPQSLVTYHHDHGQRSVSAREIHTELVEQIHSQYREYAEGRTAMAPCGDCPSKKHAAAVEAARAAMNLGQLGTQQTTANTAPQVMVPDGFVRLKFIGERRGPVTYYANGHPYTGSTMDEYRFVNALTADVDKLERMGVWQRVKMPAPVPVSIPVVDTVSVQPITVAIESAPVQPVAEPVIQPPKVQPVVIPILAEPARSAASTRLEYPPPTEQPAPTPAKAAPESKPAKRGRRKK